MKRSRINDPNQIQIDFLANHRQLLASLGPPGQLPFQTSLFVRLTDHWDTHTALPPDVLFQRTPADAVAFQLRKMDAEPSRLRFPVELIAGEIRAMPGLTGFSALFGEQGWLVVSAELPAPDKNLYTNILTATIGLAKQYPVQAELLAEAERTALAALLPEAELQKFFGIKLSRFPESFRAEITTHFNLPFAAVLKRANQIGIVTDAVLADATAPKPARSASSTNKGSQLSV